MKTKEDKIVKPYKIKGDWGNELKQLKEKCKQLTIRNLNLEIVKDVE